MPNFQRRMTNPTADDVTAALETAARDTNYRAKLGRLTTDTAAFRSAAEACLREPEGVRRWVEESIRGQFVAGRIPTTLVGLAWWTDPLGARHVLVAGRRIERGDNRVSSLFGPRDEDRPALWLLHPDRLCLRTRAGRRELVAVCPCGAVGPAAALGWMGEHCGPCHDRKEEGTPLPAPAFSGPVVFGPDWGPVSGVAFDPDGQTFVRAAVEPGKFLWDDYLSSQVLFTKLATGKRLRADGLAWALALARGGKLVAVTNGSGLWVYDAATGKGGQPQAPPQAEPVVCVALSPDDKTLALGLQGRTVRTCPLGKAGRLLDLGHRTFEAAATSLAFSPDGRTLAVGATANWVHLFAMEGDTVRHLRVGGGHPVAAVAFDQRGRSVIAGTSPRARQDIRPREARTQQAGQVFLWDLAARTPAGTPLQSHRGGVSGVAFSPDGKFVVSVGADRAVRFWDLAAGKETAALEWHVAAINALAFSPDGETLATGSDDGTVRLWPWRYLLEA
jgi:WD40 repeat protein